MRATVMGAFSLKVGAAAWLRCEDRAMSQLPSDSADSYALGRSDAETRRLIMQHQLYGPFTRHFLTAAGITAGMKVLDVGSGAGDVALLLAELVGPQGRVVGVDTNAEILDRAASRAQSAGWSTLAFRQGDVLTLELDECFDAVVGRWVLQYIPNPGALLRRARGWLRPGGIVAFQEIDLSSPPRTYPAGPLHEQVLAWTTPPPGVPGPDREMGLKLFKVFLEAGLQAPQLRRDVPVGGGPAWPGYAYLAATVRSLLPILERVGAVKRGEVDIETLEDRLRAEVIGHDGIQLLPALVGAWARI
ncbi:class I SAM-dependent methyltransferase [Micromonospora sp. 4G55]|uniref:class I SAM-dependent methyltransferase n=1 Tax=Micromonospora sp. 4G55 TaxID=2806102 RepID=UPI001A552D39|nr:class I SAM-dependent methyltransferase [Micromonospora sp. 4G55]MBM0259529.1 class I SAM-dependent methyltransferase [Micromonospora sp. 4G55]